MFQSFKVDQNYRKILTPMPISLVGAELIRRAPGLPLTRSTLSTERWSTGGTRSSSASRTAGSWWTPGWLNRRRLSTTWSTPARMRRRGGAFSYFLQLKVIDIDHIYCSHPSSGPSPGLNVTESDAEYPVTPWADTGSQYSTTGE